MADLGPVSQALEAELRDLARQHGIIVWLDKEGVYSEYVRGLSERADSGSFPFPVVPFSGSFLSMMLELEGVEDGVDMSPLIVHVPGYTEEEIAKTPAYELYRAGRRHRRALTTLARDAAQGLVPPSAIAAMSEGGLGSLDAADAWLTAQLAGDGADAGRAKLPVLGAAALYDDLLGGGSVARDLKDPAMQQAVLHHLERTLGIDARWRQAMGEGPLDRPDAMAHLLSSWALSVEFVHDLSRPPLDAVLIPLQQLPPALVEASCQLAAHLRARYPEHYARDADDLESGLVDEHSRATAEDLGRIDTFRFEDKKVFDASLQALLDHRWQKAADFAVGRTEAQSFWVKHEASRRTGWQLVRLGASLGLAVSEHETLLEGVHSLEQAAARYAAGAYAVDRAQRELEQARGQLPFVQLEEFPALRECLDELRRVYRAWADAQALKFNALCRQRGFVPDAPARQRSLFDQVVRPATEAQPTAYFMVDALRFEMGTQLRDWLTKEVGARVELTPRFAELPTLTEVGMNVLAPAARKGRLQPDINPKGIRGFRVGQARVADPPTRKKAMHERVGGETCGWLKLEELLDLDVARIRKKIARARLVVVHAEGIDKAGEKGVGLRHFEDELQRLRAACVRLREAGLRSFVITADHGFLLQDDTTRDPLAHGRKTDPKRRHVIETHGADHAGEVRVSSTELGYDGDEVHFMFPETTMPFDTGDKSKDFLHGGNSLQERLIPVLTVQYKHAAGGETTRYGIEAEPMAGVLGMHRLSLRAQQIAQTTLGFGGQRTLELRIIALDDPAINVELVDAPGARIEAGAVVAPLDKPVEILFRLTGPAPLRTKLRIEHATGVVDVEPCVLTRRFAVDVLLTPEPTSAGTMSAPVAGESAGPQDPWLGDLPEGGIRRVFEHIHRFGAIGEADATEMLGGPRKFRRFSQQFELYADKAPFGVRIDVASGQKRYVREA
ncbi:MAG: BREX-6 system phosphatase PglZ [Myxococcales bacterium]|nr:BREX-6 system phosphatase PglZ [Myxococcales bacterium]